MDMPIKPIIGMLIFIMYAPVSEYRPMNLNNRVHDSEHEMTQTHCTAFPVRDPFGQANIPSPLSIASLRTNTMPIYRSKNQQRQVNLLARDDRRLDRHRRVLMNLELPCYDPCNTNRRPTRAELRQHREGREFIAIINYSMLIVVLLFLFAAVFDWVFPE